MNLKNHDKFKLLNKKNFICQFKKLKIEFYLNKFVFINIYIIIY